MDQTENISTKEAVEQLGPNECVILDPLPAKVLQWRWFSSLVEKHIYQYVIAQYGDLPDEHIEGMSIEQIKGKISSYVQRIGNILKTRGRKEAARDILKIAHFCCYQLDKMVVEYDLKPEDFELELFDD